MIAPVAAQIARILIAVVAVLHLCFLILEMFLWRKPIGMKTFNLTREFADNSAVLSANQGLYNGFLSAGLIWGLFATDPAQAFSIKVFFLSCVTIAGIFGAITADRKILFVQACPAALALICLFVSL